jgi:hypothetical protein
MQVEFGLRTNVHAHKQPTYVFIYLFIYLFSFFPKHFERGSLVQRRSILAAVNLFLVVFIVTASARGQ